MNAIFEVPLAMAVVGATVGAIFASAHFACEVAESIQRQVQSRKRVRDD